MPPKKKPVAVLEAEGSRHYTKDELEARRAREVQAPEDEAVKAPAYISGRMLREFNRLAPVLQKMGVLSSVDGDVLAQYLIAKDQYVFATKALESSLHHVPMDVIGAERWTKLQDTYFKQCRRCATELGLTVSARANILLPQAAVESMTAEEADMFGD
jgi:P27 family predicted phage terminase small subunit